MSPMRPQTPSQGMEACVLCLEVISVGGGSQALWGTHAFFVKAMFSGSRLSPALREVRGTQQSGGNPSPPWGGAQEVGSTEKTNTERVFQCLSVTEGDNEGNCGDVAQGSSLSPKIQEEQPRKVMLKLRVRGCLGINQVKREEEGSVLG